MRLIKPEDYLISNNHFEYFGKKYNCQYAIERDTKLILQEAEQSHKDTFEELYDKESLKPYTIKLYINEDNNPIYGMIIYTINYKNSNNTRLACGDYYPISDFLELEPHPFQGQICW